jgi:hypothetical protein
MMLESKLFWHNNIIIQGYCDVQDPIKYLSQVNLLVDFDILIPFICVSAYWQAKMTILIKLAVENY